MRLPLALLAASSLAVAGCGSDVEDSGIPDGSQTGADAAATSTPAPAAAPAVDAAKQFPVGNTVLKPVGNATDLAKQPKVPRPASARPKKLVVKDLVVGAGAGAKSGDALTVRYVGVSYSTGKVFDASWKTPQNSFPFALGQGAVIKGWDQGIAGMKAGGRRELVIPPALAYGSAGSGPDIKPNETLIFIVDLKKIG